MLFLCRDARTISAIIFSFRKNWPEIEEKPVRRQGFWCQWRPKLRESLAHLVGLMMRRAVGDASAGLRVS
ncbi:hypothetical protein, partial [uncultured Tateyamaria sp.]|uniref:hypothetical protein n=1 Tax=Tateyamaria sp. 1078 TaxID=3417464 RepID=UPI002625831C